MQIGQEAAENFSTVLSSILCHLTNCKSPQSLSHKFILTYIYQKNLSINSQWFIIPSKLKLKFFVLLGFHYRIAQDSSQKHVEVQQNTLNFLTTSQCKKKYDWCHTWLQWYNWCEMLGVCSVYRCSQPSYCAGVRKHRHSAIKQTLPVHSRMEKAYQTAYTDSGQRCLLLQFCSLIASQALHCFYSNTREGIYCHLRSSSSGKTC